jgi:hypothetical protein
VAQDPKQHPAFAIFAIFFVAEVVMVIPSSDQGLAKGGWLKHGSDRILLIMIFDGKDPQCFNG